MERRAMWSSWLERTLSARDAGDYAARRAERDRAYRHLRREDGAGPRPAEIEAAAEELAGAA
jgi:hypothetical protein